MNSGEQTPPAPAEPSELERLTKRRDNILFWMKQPDGYNPDDARILQDLERQIAALSPETITPSPEERVAIARSPEELYEAIRAIGPIQGSKELYQPEKIIFYIQHRLMAFVTNTHGIRDKAIELLQKK